MVIPKVGISRRLDDESLQNVVRRAVDLVGGFRTFVKSGDRVLVKPNMVGGENVPGTMTDIHVVKAVCDLAYEAGAGRVLVADSCHVGGSTTDYAKNLGLLDLLQGTPYEFVDLKKGKIKSIPVNGEVIQELRIPVLLDDVDVIINVPVMKTHMHVKVTLATKNLKGLVHDSSKRKMHEAGVEKAIVDMTGVLHADLNIIDGIVGSEGRAPSWGVPKPMGLILAGSDSIAVDVVCSEVMGIDSMKIGYLQEAAAKGLGVADLAKIEVCGELIEDVRDSFELPPTGLLDSVDCIDVIDRDACSGCMAWLSAAISQYYDEFLELDKVLKPTGKKFNIVLGTNLELGDVPVEMRDRTIFYGKCAITKFKEYGVGKFVKGCPPALLQDLTTAAQELYEYQFGVGRKIFTTVDDLPVRGAGD